MKKREKQVLLELLESQGFDASFIDRDRVKVRCTQCEALVINGIATHEIGCPNAKEDFIRGRIYD